MADYFLLLDAADFEGRIRPTLAAARRRRSFEPCRPLCAELAPAVRAYAERYHVGGHDSLASRVADGLPFDRDRWRGLIGEVLLYTAAEIPEFQTCEDALCLLLAPENHRAGVTARERLAPIQQAHRGTRDLTFGGAVYRPEHAGYNNAGDVARLADYLAGLRPEAWRADALIGLAGADTEEDREEELVFAREWFPALADLFRRARQRAWVVVHESIY